MVISRLVCSLHYWRSRFLRIQSDLKWTDLRGLQKPLQAGSVTILPVTGQWSLVYLIGYGIT